MSGHSESVSFQTVGKSLLAIVLILASLWVFEETFSIDFKNNSLFSLGFLVFGGLAAGHLCQIVGLPSLTGYLLAGLLSGPSVFNIIQEAQVEQLRLVNGLALALIAMHAGCEFTKEMLQKNFKSLFFATGAHILIIGLGVTLLLLLMQDHIHFLKDYSLYPMAALSGLFAGVAISKSPAAVVAVLGETKIRNKLSDHALGIVVILDVVVLMLFALLLAVATSSLDPSQVLSWSSLVPLFGEIVASIAAGTFFGLFIIGYFWLIGRNNVFFIMAISYGVTAICAYLHYDTLLVFVVAGFVVTNFSKQTEKMIASIESLSSVVMIVFFATAGASLHLDVLAGVWQIVLVIVIVRAVLTWISEGVAHKLARSDIALKKYGFTPFVSQAGLSIGLAMIIYDRVPGVGPELATLAISVVTVNEIVGPVLFKWGLNQVEKLKG